MNKIKFSHEYPKLHGQTAAKLIDIIIAQRECLTDKFIEYDTAFFHCATTQHYKLEGKTFLVLLFLGYDLIPFTTVRRWTPAKAEYYGKHIGEMFDIEITKVAP